MARNPDTTDILIAGAGPVGLMAAARLRQLGLTVRVLEAAADPVQDLRASTFHPPTLEMLGELGLADRLIAQGLKAPEYQYRVRATDEVFSFDLGEIADTTAFPYRLQCEQYKLTAELAAHLERDDGCDVLFQRRVLSFRQDGVGVEVHAEAPFGIERYHAAFLIAADGANSVIRKWLGIEFDGFTYPEKFLTMSTLEPLEDYFPRLCYVNYISDPDEWLVLLRAPSAWRVLVSVPDQVDDDELTSDAWKVKLFDRLIGKGEATRTIHRTIYRVHQRVAKRYFDGRVILAGDAAHLNNPLGGLGMNSGIHDVWNLAPRLERILQAGANANDELGQYQRQRRHTMQSFIQNQTIHNKEAMEAKTTAAQERYQAEMRAIHHDCERRRAFMIRQSMLGSLQDEARID